MRNDAKENMAEEGAGNQETLHKKMVVGGVAVEVMRIGDYVLCEQPSSDSTRQWSVIASSKSSGKQEASWLNDSERSNGTTTSTSSDATTKSSSREDIIAAFPFDDEEEQQCLKQW